MASTIEDPRLRLAIYSLGLAGETGEVIEPIKKHLGHGHPLDPEALLVELGDALWYIAAIATELGFSLSDIATRNLLKLQAAYPFGFSPEASLARREQKAARLATPKGFGSKTAAVIAEDAHLVATSVVREMTETGVGREPGGPCPLRGTPCPERGAEAERKKP